MAQVAEAPASLVTHCGYARLFVSTRMTFGVFAPMEAYRSIPAMDRHLDRAALADRLGFQALWIRDVPLFDPTFGDAGTLFDPWAYLGSLAVATRSIALCTGAIVLPLRHPIHVAKAAASVDHLSGGRLVLGVASGDRPVEYPFFGVDFESRDELFRRATDALRHLWTKPTFAGPDGEEAGAPALELLPHPPTGAVPLIVVGRSRQSMEWIGRNADAWFYYQLQVEDLRRLIGTWSTVSDSKPFVSEINLDLSEDPAQRPERIHLGWRTGRYWLLDHLCELERMGVRHLVFGFRNSSRSVEDVLHELANEVLPKFVTPGVEGQGPSSGRD